MNENYIEKITKLRDERQSEITENDDLLTLYNTILDLHQKLKQCEYDYAIKQREREILTNIATEAIQFFLENVKTKSEEITKKWDEFISKNAIGIEEKRDGYIIRFSSLSYIEEDYSFSSIWDQ